MTIEVGELRQSWPRPSVPKPIVIIGAGGIVIDAHLPAYRLAELPVAGVFDLDAERTRAVAEKWKTRAFLKGFRGFSNLVRKKGLEPSPSCED